MQRISKQLIALTGLALTLLTGEMARADQDQEKWVETSVDNFYLPGGLFRSQGLANVQNEVVFSWQYGLERTTRAPDYLVLNRNFQYPALPGIPRALLALGDNHIGDIDYYDGKIYAPIEDGPAYQHPNIVVFDAKTLQPTGEVFALPLDIQGPQGVPWVAVDGDEGKAYTSQWDPVSTINVFDLNTFRLEKQITLSTVIGRIQGAKVYHGALYATSDNADKSVYKIDLEGGMVTELFKMKDLPSYGNYTVHEMEGLAFFKKPHGAVSMDVLFIHGYLDDYSLKSTTLHSSIHHFSQVPSSEKKDADVEESPPFRFAPR